jgi:hypothetical protein
LRVAVGLMMMEVVEFTMRSLARSPAWRAMSVF